MTTSTTLGRFASRKFLFMVALQIMHSVMLWHGVLDKDSYKALTTIVISGYLLSNVAQKATAKGPTT